MNNQNIIYTFIALLAGSIILASSAYLLDSLRWLMSWGREVFMSPSLGVRFRKYKIKDINLNLKRLDSEILNVLNRSTGYRDRDLLCHLHVVFTKDLWQDYKKVVGRYHPSGFYWMASSQYEKIITIDVENIHKAALKEDKVAEIIVHNYLHLWLQKYYMSADPEHKEVVWKLFGI